MLKTPLFQKSIVLGEKIKEQFENLFRAVEVKPYKSKKDGSIGLSMTLQIIRDNGVYPPGTDNFVMHTFDVTILCGTHETDIKKGDYVALGEFIEEKSYYINWNYILRYASVTKVAPPTKQGGSSDADNKR